jgi:hypothetical protein
MVLCSLSTRNKIILLMKNHLNYSTRHRRGECVIALREKGMRGNDPKLKQKKEGPELD